MAARRQLRVLDGGTVDVLRRVVGLPHRLAEFAERRQRLTVVTTGLLLDVLDGVPQLLTTVADEALELFAEAVVVTVGAAVVVAVVGVTLDALLVLP